VRLAWCTPFTQHSAIGRFSALVVSCLRERADVTVDIWYPVGAGGRTVPDRGNALTKVARKQLARYDSIIYNIGDHAPYHHQLVKLSRRYPGTLILHDMSLNNLMLGEMVALPIRDRERELRRWYGSAAGRIAEDIDRDPGHWASKLENVTRYPLSEFVLASAEAVVTHSEYAADDMRRRYAGDVFRLPLPALHFDQTEIKEVDLPMLDDRTVILQAGVVNPNKCITAVLDGFAAAQISDRAQLVIAGHADASALSGLRLEIARHGLADSVHLLGPVSDEVLHSLRHRASIATVLRDPCLEAASAVLLDSMAYGLAVVTVDSGHYVEVPDDAVVRVPVPPAGAELAEALVRLVDDPLAVAAIGSRARDYVETVHTPERYADMITDVLHEAGSYPRRRDLAADLARTIERIGFVDSDEITDIVAGAAAEIFAPQPRRVREILFG